MEMEQAFVSIGQKLGFVSAGDVRRKLEAQLADKNAKLAEKDAKLAAMEAENARLRAQLAAKQNIG